MLSLACLRMLCIFHTIKMRPTTVPSPCSQAHNIFLKSYFDSTVPSNCFSLVFYEFTTSLIAFQELEWNWQICNFLALLFYFQKKCITLSIFIFPVPHLPSENAQLQDFQCQVSSILLLKYRIHHTWTLQKPTTFPFLCLFYTAEVFIEWVPVTFSTV